MTVAVHEITHAIMNTNNQNGFLANEHLPVPPAANDQYIMADTTTTANATVARFDNATIGQINLTSKESVER